MFYFDLRTVLITFQLASLCKFVPTQLDNRNSILNAYINEETELDHPKA